MPIQLLFCIFHRVIINKCMQRLFDLSMGFSESKTEIAPTHDPLVCTAVEVKDQVWAS